MACDTNGNRGDGEGEGFKGKGGEKGKSEEKLRRLIKKSQIGPDTGSGGALGVWYGGSLVTAFLLLEALVGILSYPLHFLIIW